MKKAVVAVVLVFTVLFCLVSVTLPRHKADLYSLMYPQELSIGKRENKQKIKLNKDDCIALGTIYGEPIVWRVIEDGNNPIVWSERIICFKAFDNNSSDYRTSDLKLWLNDDNGFLSAENFSEIEKDFMFGKKGEKVFLLSKEWLQSFSQGKRAKAPTAAAVENDGSNKLIIRKNCWYWTASPVDTNSSSVATVTQTGGFYKTLASDSLTGVCPAFRLTSNEAYSFGGDGTPERPFIIQAGGGGE